VSTVLVSSVVEVVAVAFITDTTAVKDAVPVAVNLIVCGVGIASPFLEQEAIKRQTNKAKEIYKHFIIGYFQII
jgi:undecaprenyl pyrophosphate phosphatase UppP